MDADHLRIEVVLTPDDLCVRLVGELDSASAGELRAQMEEWPVHPNTWLDLTELSFLDSSGIGCLFKLQRRVSDAGGVLVARGASVAVRRVFQVTGLSRDVALLS